MAAAVQAYGSAVLGSGDSVCAAADAVLGRELLREIFRVESSLPDVLTALIANPDDRDAVAALRSRVNAALRDDPVLEARLTAMLAASCRREFAAGNTRAMAKLGHLLRWDDPDAARSVYQQAVDAGEVHALIDLARHLFRDAGDAAGAQDTYQRAIDTGDAEIVLEALADLGHMLAMRGDADGAAAAYQQAIDSGHREWAPAAMLDMAGLLQRQGDAAAARAICQRLIDSADPDSAAGASVLLADLLEQDDDVAGARAAYQRAIDSRHPEMAPVALIGLLNLLQEQSDLAGVRAAHQQAIDAGNPEAPYALVVVGNLLAAGGDAGGARDAYQRAMDADYDDVGDLLEMMSPEFEPDEDPGETVAADLPPGLDPRKMGSTGIEVLDHGLPALPAELTYQMSIPVACWTAKRCGVVLFLQFSRHRRRIQPGVTMAVFSRDGDRWIPRPHWHGTS